MALPTTYNSGTATIAANDVAVTGQNTTWATSGIQAGDVFMAAGLSVPILSVNSNTSITLADPWPGAARNTASYRIAFTPDAQRVLASTRAVLDALTNGVLYAIAGLATAADKIAYFTGQGTAALTSFTGFARSLIGAADAPSARTLLQLGSVATLNAGTNGAAIGRLDTANTWSQSQIIASATGSAQLHLDSPSLNSSQIIGKKSGKLTWLVEVGGSDALSGGNAGANFALYRYDDTGNYLGTSLTINRATGAWTIDKPLPMASGGLGANTPAGGRASLGLGTAATENTGTYGHALGFLDGANTWSNDQTITKSFPTAILNASAAGQDRQIVSRTNGINRWSFYLGSGAAESGSNAGSDLAINSYDDAGNYLTTVFGIKRATGIVSFSVAPKLPSFTVSTLPSAAANPQGIVYVSNGTANKRQAISDGTNWRFPDGAIVS